MLKFDSNKMGNTLAKLVSFIEGEEFVYRTSIMKKKLHNSNTFVKYYTRGLYREESPFYRIVSICFDEQEINRIHDKMLRRNELVILDTVEESKSEDKEENKVFKSSSTIPLTLDKTKIKANFSCFSYLLDFLAYVEECVKKEKGIKDGEIILLTEDEYLFLLKSYLEMHMGLVSAKRKEKLAKLEIEYDIKVQEIRKKIIDELSLVRKQINKGVGVNE